MELDSKKWKIYTWKHWIMIHWMLNPGLVINELILGQRVPRVSVVDKTSDQPLLERSYIPCPHCEKLHDGRTWSGQNGTAFKNWFGLYCDNCGNVIPCLMNVFSRFILLVTFPLWGWFRYSLKRKWLERQPARYATVNAEEFSNPYAGRGWLKVGLTFGALLFVVMLPVAALLTKGQLPLSGYLIAIPICLIGGIVFGYVTRVMLNKPGKKAAFDNA